MTWLSFALLFLLAGVVCLVLLSLDHEIRACESRSVDETPE